MNKRTKEVGLLLFFAATTALVIVACGADTELQGPLDGIETGEQESLSVGSFALTDDDEADDGFTPDADPSAIIEAVGDAFEEDEEPTLEESDPPDQDSEIVAELKERAFVRAVVVAWGKPIVDRDAEGVAFWKGRIHSNVARIRVLRKVRFDLEDRLIPDNDPRSVAFDSKTLPHHDGLLLLVVAPKEPSTLMGTFSFETEHFTKTIGLADLINGYHHAFRADDNGNVLSINTVPEDGCPHGTLRLRWKRMNEQGGVLGGIYLGADGKREGRIVGLWGEVNGKLRFKGLFLADDGSVEGTLRGSYRPFPADMGLEGGVFRGHWRVDDGDVLGILQGTYAVGAEPGAGFATGGWRQRCGEPPAGSCDRERRLPDADLTCECEAGDDNASSEDKPGRRGCGCAVGAPECRPGDEPVETTNAPRPDGR